MTQAPYKIEWFRYDWRNGVLDTEASEWVSIPVHYDTLEVAKGAAMMKQEDDRVPVRIRDRSGLIWSLGEVDFEAERKFFLGGMKKA